MSERIPVYTPPDIRTNVSENSEPEGARGSPASTKPQDSIASGHHSRGGRKRIPMSLPRQRLEVFEVPGYRLYWFKEANIPRALDAWYEFVHRDEVDLNRTEIAGHSGVSGNTDMGSNVSYVMGTDTYGNPIRLVLMKLALEYFKSDQMDIAIKNAEKIATIFDGESILNPEGSIDDMGALRYTPSEGASFRGRGKREYLPVMNRPKRVQVMGRGRR